MSRTDLASGTESKSVALVCWWDFYLYRYRLGLISALRERGHEVFAVAAPGEYTQALSEAGATFLPWHVTSRGINPISELRAISDLRRIYRDAQPSIAHHFTVKSNIYGAFAARLARVPATVATVTGLGYTLTNPSFKARTIGSWVRPLYRLSYRMTDVVTFQNRDDRQLISGVSRDGSDRAVYMPGGSGVDLDSFHPGAVGEESLGSLRTELKITDDELVVVLVGRMLWEKGVREYVDAARQIRKRLPKARFLLIGRTEASVSGYIPPETLNSMTADGSVAYLGERTDVRELLALSDLAVLPSYWEGTPRALLEASAMGKPIVTTDVPGCRDVVSDGVTGLLVAPKNADSLARAIETLLADPDRARRYGEAARDKAEREFDEGAVIDRFLEIYEDLWTRTEPRKGPRTTDSISHEND